MDTLNTAEIGATLEVGFDKIAKSRQTDDLGAYGLDGYTLVDVGSFTRETGETYPKAITVRDPDGNIFVHFRGTGDGNWGYNAAAYGGPPSSMQEWSLEYFNEMVETHYEGQSADNLYVTGHSQGGNNAQFVTIRSEYGDYITNCLTLDGPGFSTQFVEDSINLYGEAYYDRQRDKIFAYKGTHNFVSCLGQESIIPDRHTEYVPYTNPFNKDRDVMMYHHALGLLKDGMVKLETCPLCASGNKQMILLGLREIQTP